MRKLFLILLLFWTLPLLAEDKIIIIYSLKIDKEKLPNNEKAILDEKGILLDKSFILRKARFAIVRDEIILQIEDGKNYKWDGQEWIRVILTPSVTNEDKIDELMFYKNSLTIRTKGDNWYKFDGSNWEKIIIEPNENKK